MKKIKLLAIISLLAFTCTNIKAQNSDHRWAIGVYGNWINFDVSHQITSLRLREFQGKKQMIPSAYSLGRFISPSLNVVGAFSTNKFDIWHADEFKYMRWLRTNEFWDADASIEYKFANGYILKESSWFAPYVYGGVGVANYNKTSYFKEVVGVGADFWILHFLALNVHGSADVLNSGDSYIHLFTGLKVRFGGARDTDKDGVADKDDRCPTEFGLKELKGCPDTDGDGIADLDDKCAGTPAGVKVDAMGCPIDSDKDGVADYLDKCPDTPAGVIVDEKGCPVDSDNDGVADYLDKCPNTPTGVKVDANGCTVDADNDGVPDALDKCPDTPAGVKVDAAGCPIDTDKDGVADYLDKCPTIPGIAANNGCPEIKKEEQAIINTAFSNLEFVTGKWIIKKVSYPSLSRLAELLMKKPEWKVQLSGHTDNVGSDASNMKLSENRAMAVKEFLESKGVPEERIKAEWFGESKPIAPNETKEGRQKNRRVEMAIFF
jgi:OmpA-OmpF porin, OOP family